MLGQEIDELEHNVRRRMKRAKDASLLVAIVLLPEIYSLVLACGLFGASLVGHGVILGV